MTRFRYRTAALRGRWRDSRREAVRDAVQAKQAVLEEGTAEGVRWLVPGDIESDMEARAG